MLSVPLVLAYSVTKQKLHVKSVSQQVWHDKDPSLLKGHKPRAKAWILQSSVGFGDNSIINENILELCENHTVLKKQIKLDIIYFLGF